MAADKSDDGNVITFPVPESMRAKLADVTPDARETSIDCSPRFCMHAKIRVVEHELAVLKAVAQHSDGVTREQVSILTGYKRSTRDAYLQRLGAKGATVQRGDHLFATESGVDALGADFEPLPTGAALRAHWLQRLPEGERKVLEVTASAYPGAVSRDAVSEVTGYKRSTRDAYIQRLGVRRLVRANGSGITASEELFG